MTKILSAFNSEFPIDILIANAGISSGTAQTEDPAQAFYKVFETNSIGVINTVLPVLGEFIKRRRGQIVIMGSLAGNISTVIPESAVPYSASKAAAESLSYSWRKQCKPAGVGVTLITPGYVQTPLTDQNTFSMPLIMPADEAAQIMIDGISRDYALVSYPALMSWGSWLVKIIPANLVSMFL